MGKDAAQGKARGKAKGEGVFKRAAREAEALAGGSRIEAEGYALYQYPDYDTYRAVQTAGNKAKLGRQFVKESHILQLAAYLGRTVGPCRFGLCHGTRRGAEQAWFRAHLPGAPQVIGTEISDTATQFPDTVQWDFHDPNPDWDGRADFVYSNSWDHAFDPVRAFGAWIAALRPGGVMLLDHTKDQTPDTSNALDPFGASLDRLVALLDENFADRGRVTETLDFRKTNPDYRACVVVFTRTA
jgi:hypothetical protein